MFPCYGMWFRINTCSESPLAMYIWTSWFAHFLRQTKLKEDYPPIERERERESIWKWSFRYKSEAFSITKGQRGFSFFLLRWHRNTSFLLHYEHLETSFTGMEIEQPQRVVVVLMSSWHAAMGCDWIKKPYFFEWRKIGWGPQCKNLEPFSSKAPQPPLHTVQCHNTSIWLPSGKCL